MNNIKDGDVMITEDCACVAVIMGVPIVGFHFDVLLGCALLCMMFVSYIGMHIYINREVL